MGSVRTIVFFLVCGAVLVKESLTQLESFQHYGDGRTTVNGAPQDMIRCFSNVRGLGLCDGYLFLKPSRSGMNSQHYNDNRVPYPYSISYEYYNAPLVNSPSQLYGSMPYTQSIQQGVSESKAPENSLLTDRPSITADQIVIMIPEGAFTDPKDDQLSTNETPKTVDLDKRIVSKSSKDTNKESEDKHEKETDETKEKVVEKKTSYALNGVYQILSPYESSMNVKPISELDSSKYMLVHPFSRIKADQIVIVIGGQTTKNNTKGSSLGTENRKSTEKVPETPSKKDDLKVDASSTGPKTLEKSPVETSSLKTPPLDTPSVVEPSEDVSVVDKSPEVTPEPETSSLQEKTPVPKEVAPESAIPGESIVEETPTPEKTVVEELSPETSTSVTNERTKRVTDSPLVKEPLKETLGSVTSEPDDSLTKSSLEEKPVMEKPVMEKPVMEKPDSVTSESDDSLKNSSSEEKPVVETPSSATSEPVDL